jgi:hypothetical protein
VYSLPGDEPSVIPPRHTCLILYFDIDVKLLEQMGEGYPWPRPPWCPRCRSPRLWGHGYVGRFFDGFEKALLLKRYRCPDCGAVHTLRPQFHDRRFQVIWFTIFLSLLKKITHGRWLVGISRQRQQYWWRGFKKHASRKQNFVPETALATLIVLFEAEHLLATHSLTHYERRPLGESPHRRFAATFPYGVG